MHSATFYSYDVYGLHVVSTTAIPGFSPHLNSLAQRDVLITLGIFPIFFTHITQPENPLEMSTNNESAPFFTIKNILNDEYIHIQYNTGIEFLFTSDGSRIWGRWNNNFTTSDLPLYIQGPILAYTLRLKNHVCIHASAVVINGSAYGFTGFSGSGKSTLAAAFACAGHTILTDDILPIREDKDIFWASPGYPHLRLYQEKLPWLEKQDEELPLLTQRWRKRFLDLNKSNYQFCNHPVPLAALYILDWSTIERKSIEILEVNSVDKIISLAPLTYGSSYLNPPMIRREFEMLSQISKTISVRRVHPVKDQIKIQDFIDRIIDDIANNNSD
jgi:energy-coupling factor transporter ATP-binding protein EcfA2